MKVEGHQKAFWKEVHVDSGTGPKSLPTILSRWRTAVACEKETARDVDKRMKTKMKKDEFMVTCFLFLVYGFFFFFFFKMMKNTTLIV